MAKNKIGIEVQVQFPTIRELQTQINEKYDEKIDLKVKLGVSRDSMTELKSQIQNAFDRAKAFEVKVNFDNSLTKLKQIKETVDDIDKKLGKTRTFKIDFNIKDMDKTMTEILKNQKDASKELTTMAQKHAEQRKQAYAEEVRSVVAGAKQIARAQTMISNLGEANESRRFKLVDNQGDKTATTTVKPDGTRDVSYSYNNEKVQLQALKEIEDQLKTIQKLRLDINDATGQHKQFLIDQKKVEEQIVRDLNDQYEAKYGIRATQEESVKNLIEQHKYAIKLRDIAEQERDTQNEIAQAISKVTQLETKKQQLSRQIAGATEEEAQHLRQQLQHYDNIQQKLIQKHDVMNKMSAEQREEFSNIQRIGSLQEQQVKDLREQSELAKMQKDIMSDMQEDLRNIHRLELQILEMKQRQQASGRELTVDERARLEILQQELGTARQVFSASNVRHTTEGNITQEMREQLLTLENIQEQERQRIVNASRIQGEADKTNQELKEYQRITQEINRLNRDLIFAGMREQDVIQEQVDALENARSAVLNRLETEQRITAEMRQQLQTAERLQREQNIVAEDRRLARERDQAYNDTGGLVDPWSFAGNVEQGAMAVFEPIQRLDEALTGVSKVAEATEEDMQAFAEGSYDAGAQLGVTADQYMLAVEKWVTAGKEFQESQELANVAMTGAFVGNISPDDMVKYMSVPMNAYEGYVEATDVINVMNEVANKNAIEMVDLGKAYVRSATTAKNAGATYGELTGMITAAQEATRKGGERIGTGLKTIGINIQSIQSRFKKIDVTNFDYLTELGMSLMNEDGTAKTMTQVIEELVKVQDKLRPEEFSNAIKAMAGKEHAETLQAIVDQWDTVQKVIGETDGELGLGEAGSAYTEHAKQSDSVKFKLAELQNAWDELMHTIGGGGNGVTKVMDMLIRGLNELNELAQNKALMEVLKYILAGVAIHAGANLWKRFFDTIDTGFRGMARNALEARNALQELRGEGRRGARGANNTELVPVPQRNVVNGRTTNRREIVTAQRENRRRQADAEANSTAQAGQRANNTLRTTGKLIGKVAGFIPILGDALLVLDLMGVPVFEKMGDLVETMGESVGRTNKKFDEMNTKFRTSNMVMNGNVADTQKGIDGMRTSLEEMLKVDKNTEMEGLQNYLDVEQFQTFSKQFNDMASAIGHKEIQITMNDTSHIFATIDKLQKALNNLNAEENVDIAKKLEKDTKKYDSAESNYANAQAERESMETTIENHKSKEKSMRDQGFDKAYEENLKRYEQQLQKLIDKEKEAGITVQDTAVIIGESAQALLKQGDAIKITGMTKDQATGALKGMIDQYAVLNEKQRDYALIQDIANGKTTVGAKEWARLTNEVLPQYAGVSQDAVRADENVRNSMVTTAQTAIDSGNTQIATAEGAMGVVAQRAGMENELKTAIEETKTSTENGATAVGTYRGELDKIEPKKSTQIDVNVDGDLSWFEKVLGFFKTGKWHTSATVDVGGKDSTKSSGKKSGFVSTASNAISSASISSANTSTGGALISSPTTVDNATSSGTSTPPAKVNSDIWRYWGREMANEDITQAINKLTSAIQNATDNEAELIKLYKEQNKVLRTHESGLNSLAGLKQSEMNEILASLRKHGFKTSGNDITNLGLSKSFSGDKATDVEELLNKWRQLGTDLTGISQSIADLNETIKENNEAIKKAEIQKELESWEKSIKKIDALITNLSNKANIFDRKLGFISNSDKELGLFTNEQAMNSAKESLSSLIKEFNTLSQSSIAYEENGEVLKGTLEQLGSEILAQSDAIVQYQQAINDLEFSRVTDDLNEFNDAIDKNQARISNNVENLKEGLLSGTNLGDLQSSTSVGLDLSRDNQYEQLAQERISLEEKVQQAMDAFAKKNVDRQAGIANETLRIEATKYNKMLQMASDYSSGNSSSFEAIKAIFENLTGIGAVDDSYTFVTELDNAFEDLKSKQDALTKKYNDDMAKTLTMENKDSLTNQFIIDNLKLQEEYYQASIGANKNAIEELERQLTDTSLTDEQEEAIKQQIADLEQANIDAQNSIKDSIADRFAFEFSLLEEAFDKYDKYASELTYAMDILDALGGQNTNARGAVLDEMLNAEKARNAQIVDTLDTLKEQQSMYEEGSYEWNLINEQVEQYNQLLRDSNLELLDMNHNLMSNSFSGTLGNIEKSLFGGKTLAEFERMQELWLSGVEREIALEDTYQRLADLGTQIHDEKMAQLAKQEKLSRFEMDYLNKQLDVLELQQKLDNLNKEKTIQTLKQNADGTWDWQYEADAEQISQVQDELAQKELELQQAEEQARKDYLSQLEDILSQAEEGNFDSIEDFQSAIDDLSDAFDSIVGDFPEIGDEYLKELIEAYSEYLTNNQDILDGIMPTTPNDQAFEGFSSEIVKAFSEISSDIGTAIADALIAKLPSFASPTEKTTEDKSVSIVLEKLEFPNVTSANGLKEAILSLPQIALQKSKEK